MPGNMLCCCCCWTSNTWVWINLIKCSAGYEFVVAMVTLSVPQTLTFSHDTLHLGWGLACQRDFICLILIYFLHLASRYLFPKLHPIHPSLPHSAGWGIFSDVLIKLQIYADNMSLGHGGMTFSVFLPS